MRQARLGMAILLLSFAAAGCTSKAGEPKTTPAPTLTPTSAASPTPAGNQGLPPTWVLHVDDAQGFAIAFPTAWDFGQRDSPTFDADLKTVQGHSAELGKYFSDSFKANDQVRLIAADPRSLQAGFAVNVNVMVAELGSVATAPSLDDLSDAKIRRLKQQGEVIRPIKRTTTRLSGHDASQLDYDLIAGGNVIQIRSVFTLVDRGNRRFLAELTMGAPAKSKSTTFEDLARLFSLFPPGHPPIVPTASPSSSP